MESSGDSEITANQRYSGDDPVQSEPGRLQSARRTAAARAAGSRRTGIVSNLHGTITRRAYRLACQHRIDRRLEGHPGTSRGIPGDAAAPPADSPHVAFSHGIDGHVAGHLNRKSVVQGKSESVRV